jgi:hypothetical protein
MSDVALARLRHPDGAALRGLAALVADEIARAPLSELVPPARVAAEVRRWIVAAAASPTARDAVIRRVEALRRSAATPAWRDRTLRGWMVPELESPLRELLATPWSPDEALVLRLINHGSVKSLLASVLSASLQGFVDRVRNVDDGLLGGIGGKAVQRGRGLFGGLASGLGSAAEGLVGTVRAEIQSALEGRIQPFVGQASEDAVARIAAWLADPEHADSLAELRLAVADVVLDTPVAEWARQLDGVDLGRVADLVLAAARGAAERPDFDDRVGEAVRAALDLVGDGTLAGALDEAGLREAWRASLTDAGAERLHSLVATDTFATWWEELHR